MIQANTTAGMALVSFLPEQTYKAASKECAKMHKNFVKPAICSDFSYTPV